MVSLQEKIFSKTIAHMDVVLKGNAGRQGIFKTLLFPLLFWEAVADFAGDPHKTSSIFFLVFFWWNKSLLLLVKTGKLKCIS